MSAPAAGPSSPTDHWFPLAHRPLLALCLCFLTGIWLGSLWSIPFGIWLGLGAHELGGWLRGTAENLLEGRNLSRLWRGALVAVPTLALLTYLVAMQPRAVAQYTNIGSFRTEHKTIGLWMKDNIPRDSVVMSRFPAIAFYAEQRWEPAPNADYSQALDYARANDVQYWALDEEETRVLRPQFAFLLDASKIAPELQLVHTLESARGKLSVFRVLKAPAPLGE